MMDGWLTLEYPIRIPADKEGENKWIYLLCPKCSHTRKKQHQKEQCLSVHPAAGFWKCHNCDYSGNLASYNKYSEIRKESGMPSQIGLYPPSIREFFERKGINPEIARQRLVYPHEKMPSVICYPYFSNYTLVNVYFRDTQRNTETGKFRRWQISKEKGTKMVLWGIDSIKRPSAGKFIVTLAEGETDVLTWLTAGYENIAGLPGGAPAPNSNVESRLEWITDKSVQSVLEQADAIYISTDGDANGKYYAEAIAKRVGQHKCWIPTYPSGYKDINEIWWGDKGKGLAGLGQTGVDAFYKSFKPIPLYGIIVPAMVKEEIRKIREGGFERGLLTGNPNIDNLFSIRAPWLLTITGWPGSGKSIWIRWALVQMMKKHPEMKLGLYTPEDRPPSRTFTKFMELYVEKPIEKSSRWAMNEEVLNKAYEWIKPRLASLNPEFDHFYDFGGKVKQEQINSLDGLLEYYKTLKINYGITGYVLDAWNKLEHIYKGVSEHQYISRELDKILNFNAKYDLFCILVAHPRKEDGRRGKIRKMPTLNEISGSGSFESKTDIGLVVHTDYYKYKRDRNGIVKDDFGFPEEVKIYAPVTKVWAEKIKFVEMGNMGHTERFFWHHSKGGIYVPDETGNAKMKESETAEMYNEPHSAEPETEQSSSPIPEDDLPF